jgi:Tautomerase enzyme
MPLVTFTLLENCSNTHLKAVLDSTHIALTDSGFAQTDRFQRVNFLRPEHFVFDRTFPDLASPRSDRFVLIEILIGMGRNADFKKEMMASIVKSLQNSPGIAPNDVMIMINETERMNISFAAGFQGLPVTST